MRVRLPCLPLDAPMVKGTIIPRFERGVPGLNPGRGAGSPVVQQAGHPHDMGKIAGSNPAGTIKRWCLWCSGLACDPVKVVAAGSIPPRHPGQECSPGRVHGFQIGPHPEVVQHTPNFLRPLTAGVRKAWAIGVRLSGLVGQRRRDRIGVGQGERSSSLDSLCSLRTGSSVGRAQP